MPYCNIYDPIDNILVISDNILCKLFLASWIQGIYLLGIGFIFILVSLVNHEL